MGQVIDRGRARAMGAGMVPQQNATPYPEPVIAPQMAYPDQAMGLRGQVIDRSPALAGQVIDRGRAPGFAGQVIDRGRLAYGGQPMPQNAPLTAGLRNWPAWTGYGRR